VFQDIEAEELLDCSKKR